MTATSATTHPVPGTLADLGPAGAHQPPHQCAQPDLQLGSLDRALDFLRKCKARVASPSDVAATAKPAVPVVAVAPQPVAVGGAHECDRVATPKPATPRSATPRTDALRAALALSVPRLACTPPSDPAILDVVGPAVAPAAADPAPARSAAAPRTRHPKLIPADRVPTGAVVKPVPALVPAAAAAAAKTTPPRAPRTRRRSHPADSAVAAAPTPVHSSRHAAPKPAALHIAPSTTVHSDSASTSAAHHRTPRSATSARHHRGSATDKSSRHGVPAALASPTSPTFTPTKWTPAHPQTVHIFVDNSNILHGAQNLANQLPKQQRRALVPPGATLGLSYARLAKVITAMLDTVVAGHVHHATCPAACLPANASTTPSTSTRSMLRRAAMPRSIDDVMALRAQIPKCTCGVGGMPAHYYQIVKKVLVASRPLVQDLRDAQALAFETLVLDRVYHKSRGNAARSPSSSGSSSAGAASDDWSGMESDTSTRASDYSGMKGRPAVSAAPQPAAQPSLDLQAILNAFRLAAAAKKNSNNDNSNNDNSNNDNSNNNSNNSNNSINNGHSTAGPSSAQHHSATTTKSTSTASSSSTSLAATTTKRASSTASMARSTTKRVAATAPTTPSSSTGGGRGKEMFVDELLHVKMADSMLDYDRGILILLTGDGAVAQFTDGFGAQVARALRRGWTVIVASFAACLSSVYGKLAKQAAAAAAMAEAEGVHAGGSLHLFVLDADVANLVCVV
ncbi:hypothetical protein GGF32_003031 [Allomyces javanicus]|nr:hypothetical protein GGF32_003031 [Allomyces javanicus]